MNTHKSKTIKITLIFSLITGLLLILFILTGGISESGYSILIKAVEENDTKRSLSLISLNAPTEPPYDGMTTWFFTSSHDGSPIQIAANNGNFEIVEALIKSGAKIDYSCCMAATALHRAIINKHTNIVQLLLESGADIRLESELGSALDLSEKSTTEIRQLVTSHKQSLHPATISSSHSQ